MRFSDIGNTTPNPVIQPPLYSCLLPSGSGSVSCSLNPSCLETRFGQQNVREAMCVEKPDVA